MSNSDRQNGRTHEPSLREVTAEVAGLRIWAASEMKSIRDIMDEREKRYNERYTSSEKAIGKAEAAQEAYNTSHNDLVRKMDDQNKATMPRIETEQRFRAVEEKIHENRNNETGHLGEARGGRIVKDESRANLAIIIAVVTGLISAGMFFMMFIRGLGG